MNAPTILSPLGLPVDVMQLPVLLAIVALFAAYGVLLWAIRGRRREARWLRCPLEDGAMRRVVVDLDQDGMPRDVVRCARFHGRKPITCGKPCLAEAA